MKILILPVLKSKLTCVHLDISDLVKIECKFLIIFQAI